MKRTTHLRLTSFFRLSDCYAFQAGVFVVLFLIAALTNFGVSILLIIAAATFTRLRSKAAHWRGIAEDFFILTIGLLAAITMNPASGLFAMYGSRAIVTTVFAAIILLVTKGTLLVRAVRTLITGDVQQLASKNGFVLRGRLVFTGVLVAFSLLLLSLLIISGGWATVASILLNQLIPWRF